MNFFEILIILKDGMIKSVEIFLLTLAFALPLGLLMAFGRMSKFKPLSYAMKFIISILRGTPLMLQLFVVYFSPWLLFQVSLRFVPNWLFISVIIGFSINYAAYFAEIYRSGISSVPIGQTEAGKVLGMSKMQTFFLIVFPQVIRNILPAMTNEIITLVKDTSLSFSIGVIEMFTMAKMLAAAETSMLPYLVAAVIYYLFNLLVATLLSLLEKKLNKYSIR